MDKELVTAVEGVKLLQERGYPISRSTFQKMSMKSSPNKPPVAGFWGRYRVYNPPELLEWARSLVRTADPV